MTRASRRTGSIALGTDSPVAVRGHLVTLAVLILEEEKGREGVKIQETAQHQQHGVQSVWDRLPCLCEYKGD